MIDGRTKLKKALVQAEGHFDMVVLDTPPNLGALTVNALVAAHEVVIPVQTKQADVNELPTFLETFEEVRVNLNVDLKVAGLLPTRYDCRKAQDQQVLAMLRDNPIGARCFEPIPERARIQECFTVGKPVFDFNRDAGLEYERAVEALAGGR
jgi:chromosome partitioning protein